jgi:hypothetical protein
MSKQGLLGIGANLALTAIAHYVVGDAVAGLIFVVGIGIMAFASQKDSDGDNPSAGEMFRRRVRTYKYGGSSETLAKKTNTR